MAERQGFEPWERLRAQRFSREGVRLDHTFGAKILKKKKVKKILNGKRFWEEMVDMWDCKFY